MKHRAWMTMLGLVSLLHGVPAGAQPIEALSEDSSYSYMHEGKVEGPGSQVVTAVLTEAGLSDYRLGIYPWARVYDRGLREPDILLYPLLRTPEREMQFKWVGLLDVVVPALYRLRSTTGVRVATLQEARNYSVGVVRDDYRETYLRDEGFTRLVVSANYIENFNRLLNGQVQLVPMPERDARKLCAAAHIPYEALETAYTMDGLSKEGYIAFSNATSDEVVKRARAAYEHLKRTGAIARMLEAAP